MNRWRWDVSINNSRRNFTSKCDRPLSALCEHTLPYSVMLEWGGKKIDGHNLSENRNFLIDQHINGNMYIIFKSYRTNSKHTCFCPQWEDAVIISALIQDTPLLSTVLTRLIPFGQWVVTWTINRLSRRKTSLIEITKQQACLSIMKLRPESFLSRLGWNYSKLAVYSQSTHETFLHKEKQISMEGRRSHKMAG